MIASALCAPLLTEFPSARRWVVAFSGGLDSHVLLHLCASLRAAHPAMPPLLALHVNHGVQAAADAWAAHCAGVCGGLGVDLETRAIVPPVTVPPSEELLRVARYRVFEEFCAPGDLLLLAHHRDDQAETVLLRLVRGAGAAGLAGMPRERPCGAARLCRPLLDVARDQLLGYARARGLRWVEDPSNAATEPDRNFVRHRVMPLLAGRWPGAAASMARAAHSLGQAAAICAERAREDLDDCRGVDRFGQAFLGLAPWRALGAARATAVLRTWLEEQGAGKVGAQTLDTLRQEVIGARNDAQPVLACGAVTIRRYRERLYAVAAGLGQVVPAAVRIAPGECLSVPGSGRIALAPGQGGGVRPGLEYQLRFGAPGSRCRPVGRPGKSLKQLAQESGVPPWLRRGMPLLYVDGELAAVADLCVCEGFAAPPGSTGLRLSWQAGDCARATT